MAFLGFNFTQTTQMKILCLDSTLLNLNYLHQYFCYFLHSKIQDFLFIEYRFLGYLFHPLYPNNSNLFNF